MELLEQLRKSFFWTLDRIKDRQVGKHFENIQSVLENENSTEAIKIKKEALEKLLHHATHSTSFYSDLKGKENLTDFPVLDKNIIRQNFEALISNKFKKDKLKSVVTSGSTGTPFKVLQDTNKQKRNTADTIYFAKKTGYEIGQKLLYLKIWNSVNQKNAISAWAQNILAADVTKLSDSSIEHILKAFSLGSSKKGILSYASALELISQYIDRKKLQVEKYNVSSIIAMSEAINKSTKEKLEKQFGTKVVSRYSNVENGILAQQCLEENNEFHLNTASYVFEILKLEKDEPTEDGKLGRIVVTDLYNYGMPIIRYDTGDLGIKESSSNCSFNTPVFTSVEGRRMDMIFDTKGEIISSFTITNNLWGYPEIVQYQFIQTGEKEYEFILNLEEEFSREQELIEEFKGYLGLDAIIKVSYVDGIPLLNSGKRKKVINKYHTV